jgi:mannose PTS system EIIA component
MGSEDFSGEARTVQIAQLGAVGVVLVTHGKVGEEMVRAVEKIVGSFSGVATVAFKQGEPPESLSTRVEKAARSVDAGGGVLFLTDLHGATPSNVCTSLLGLVQAGETLCGLNLPMLLKLATADRSTGPHALAEALQETGRRSIRASRELSTTGRFRLPEETK